jgi:uncharacterized membrane protein YccC
MSDDDEPPRADNWVVGSWLRPALLTLVALAAAIGTIHRYRDVGSVLAAVVCAAFTVIVWREWRNGRDDRSSRRPPE